MGDVSRFTAPPVLSCSTFDDFLKRGWWWRGGDTVLGLYFGAALLCNPSTRRRFAEVFFSILRGFLFIVEILFSTSSTVIMAHMVDSLLLFQSHLLTCVLVKYIWLIYC